jgi:hypothetical protein
MSSAKAATLRAVRASVFFLFSCWSCWLFASSSASAQVHVDAGAHVGVMKRVLTNRSAGDAGFGPVAEVHAHVAVLPMLRLGAYFSYDISPVSGVPARHIRSVGARVKITPPWPRGDLRLSLVTGAGYAMTYGPSYRIETLGATPGTQDEILVDGQGGQFVEIPLAVGASYKLRRPLELTAELGTRFGLAPMGTLYEEPTGRARSGATAGVPPLGNDTLAIYLAVGLQLDL